MPTFAEAPVPESEMTYTRFDRMSEQFPSRPAVIYLGERFSYRRLRALSDRFAGALAAMGVGKGDRVSASEVKAALQDHPTVIGACVVGIPDTKVGERIKAIVVLKEDARGVGGTELMTFCRQRLAAYKVPSYIEFRDMLPKSKVGKLLRREVRDDERRRMAKGKTAFDRKAG
jgi:long-chain acyl-CoA synthetase